MSARPPLPSLRALTRELRALHDAWSHPDAGGEYARLVCECLGCVSPYYQWRVYAAGQIDSVWVAHRDEGGALVYGWEYIPGSVERQCPDCPAGCPDVKCGTCDDTGRVSSPSPFDAVAAARRLLAAAREANVRTEPTPTTRKET
jgi:hypothetical protein